MINVKYINRLTYPHVLCLHRTNVKPQNQVQRNPFYAFSFNIRVNLFIIKFKDN